MSVHSPRPANRRTHYHVGIELRAAKQRERCLALRLEGRKLREIAREVGISPSTVNGHIQQSLRDSRQTSTAMGEQLREQEWARLLAVIDRWMPVATGKYRTKEAARAAGIVAKASDRLQLLFGLPAATPTLPPAVAAPEPPPLASEPEPTPVQKVLYFAFDDIALRMAKAGLLPTSSYDDAWDALLVWQPDKYEPASVEVERYLRQHWAKLLTIRLN